MNEPLENISRKDLQLGIMRNIEREIVSLHKNNKLRYWWERAPNWVKVQRFITGNTCKAGSTSAGILCEFLGVSPDGKSFYPEPNK